MLPETLPSEHGRTEWTRWLWEGWLGVFIGTLGVKVWSRNPLTYLYKDSVMRGLRVLWSSINTFQGPLLLIVEFGLFGRPVHPRWFGGWWSHRGRRCSGETDVRSVERFYSQVSIVTDLILHCLHSEFGPSDRSLGGTDILHTIYAIGYAWYSRVNLLKLCASVVILVVFRKGSEDQRRSVIGGSRLPVGDKTTDSGT